ncbi:MAG: PEP-CTERM sorting domain-containing protein [Chthonomonas sp.]|nr:PEP-CTERM sorting domain-containing protein [Chthonomonas sp.]
MKSFFSVVVLLASAGAFAQNYSAFYNAGPTFVDVSVTGLNPTYTVSIGATPTVTLGGTTYNIKDVFGFWVLGVDPGSATNTATGVWSPNNNNAGPNWIFGWSTNPNTGLTANTSKTFTFDSLSGNIESFGFHVRLVDGQAYQGNNTFFVKGSAVPEPATMAALGLGVAALIRRRKIAK